MSDWPDLPIIVKGAVGEKNAALVPGAVDALTASEFIHVYDSWETLIADVPKLKLRGSRARDRSLRLAPSSSAPRTRGDGAAARRCLGCSRSTAGSRPGSSSRRIRRPSC